MSERLGSRASRPRSFRRMPMPIRLRPPSATESPAITVIRVRARLPLVRTTSAMIGLKILAGSRATVAEKLRPLRGRTETLFTVTLATCAEDPVHLARHQDAAGAGEDAVHGAQDLHRRRRIAAGTEDGDGEQGREAGTAGALEHRVSSGWGAPFYAGSGSGVKHLGRLSQV